MRIANGGLESEEFQLAYVPDPKSEVDQLRREDVRELNRRMSDSNGAVMRRKRFFFGSGAEVYYAFDLENRLRVPSLAMRLAPPEKRKAG